MRYFDLDSYSGGQLGHQGVALELVDTPDKVELHKIDAYKWCGHRLENGMFINYKQRQEIDIPKIKPIVTETPDTSYEIKKYLHCGIEPTKEKSSSPINLASCSSCSFNFN